MSTKETGGPAFPWEWDYINSNRVGEAVRMPTSADEAELMEKLGFAYLQQHAPERLTKKAEAARNLVEAAEAAVKFIGDLPVKVRECKGGYALEDDMGGALRLIGNIKAALAAARGE